MHNYYVWLEVGVAVTTFDKIDTDTSAGKQELKNWIADRIAERGIHEVIADAEIKQVRHEVEE